MVAWKESIKQVDLFLGRYTEHPNAQVGMVNGSICGHADS